MLSVNRPIDVVVLNCCVTATKETPLRSENLDQLCEVRQAAREAVDLVDDHGIDLPRLDVAHQSAQPRPFHVAARVAAVVVSVVDGYPTPCRWLGVHEMAKPASRCASRLLYS